VDETLDGARQRFEAAWKRFYPKLRKAGLRGALATYHVTPGRGMGWHYHCHLLIDIEAVESDVLAESLGFHWARARKDELDPAGSIFFCREVCAPGGPLVGLATDTQMDFFTESKDPVEVCLQYMVRDILQGVEKWVGKFERPEMTEEFSHAMDNLKTHRLYGTWRKAVPGDESEAKAESEDRQIADEVSPGVKTKGVSEWREVMGVDALVRLIRCGETRWLDLLQSLIGTRSQLGPVSLRLSRLVSALRA